MARCGKEEPEVYKLLPNGATKEDGGYVGSMVGNIDGTRWPPDMATGSARCTRAWRRRRDLVTEGGEEARGEPHSGGVGVVMRDGWAWRGHGEG